MSFGRRKGRRFDTENQSPTHFYLFMIRLQNSSIKSHLTLAKQQNSADKNSFDSNKQQISIL